MTRRGIGGHCLDVQLPDPRGSLDCAVEADGSVLAIGGSTWEGADVRSNCR